MTSSALDRPVFLLGAHKSGTSLVRSLLDGHPDLFVVPIEMHFFKRARLWVDYDLGKKARPPTLDLAATRDAYERVVEEYNSVAQRYGDADMVGRFDMAKVHDRMHARAPTSRRDLIVDYFHAVHAGLHGGDIAPGRRVVEKTVEHAEHAVDLQRMFPDARFVHILRNPYANLVSIRRHMTESSFPFLYRGVTALENSLYFLYRNRDLIDEYAVVRYEDVLTKPEETMEGLARALDLPFHETLLQPTSVGSSWEGNSSRGVSYKGISAANIDRWKEDITDLEIRCVTRRVPFVLDEFGYERMEPRRSPDWPIRGESLRAYVANRVISRL